MYNTFFQEMKTVYNALMDEESKDIFRNLVLFRVTGDWSYVKYIVGHYLRGYEGDEIFTGLQDNLQKLELKPQDEYIVYGAGMFGRIAYQALEKQGIYVKAFCDANAEKQKEKFCGLRVLSPEDLQREEQTKVLFSGKRLCR